MGQERKLVIQIYREDWEAAGDYTDVHHCPMATALTRILGYPVVFSWNSANIPGGDVIGHIEPRFATVSYRSAKRAYEAGQVILFDTTFTFKQHDLNSPPWKN